MKTIFLFILFTLFGFGSYSQLLKGEWEGTYVTNKTHYPIYLDFVLNSDSSYSVYSYSKGSLRMIKQENTIQFQTDSVVVCKVYFKFLSPDSIYLEEIEVVEPKNYADPCFQKMYLKIEIKADKIKLLGTWKASKCSNKGSGEISFWKKKDDVLK